MASSSYEYYLSEVLGSWAGNPILPSQWLVLFHFNSLRQSPNQSIQTQA